MRTARGRRRLGTAVAVAAALLAVEAPTTGPEVMLDAFTTTAHEVGEWRRAGAVPVCRLQVAVWEPDRPDADRFPPHLRAGPAGAGGERWLDIRAWDELAPVLSDRLRLCREKGFPAVTFGPDWSDPAGIGLTTADWRRFGNRVEPLADEHDLEVRGAAGVRGLSGGDGAGSGDRSTTTGW